MEVDAFGTLTFGYNDGELVPIANVTSLIINGGNKDEQFDVEANVNVTVNGAGGSDWISVTAPFATVSGGAGDDTVFTANGRYFVELGLGANTMFGGNGVDFVRLASGATDRLYLAGGDDVVDALFDDIDDDYIDGGDGFDTLYVTVGHPRSAARLANIERIEQV
jgi:Ca2+-binding RTX toxin-like protein